MCVAAGPPDDHHDIAALELLNRADGGPLRAPPTEVVMVASIFMASTGATT